MNDSTVQDVFIHFYDDYLKQYKVSSVQSKAAWSIMNCKTGALGANISVCEECGTMHVHYNSCRNRCCPMCQELPKEKWVDARKEDVLDAPYFHVVFTLPDELNPVIYSNQKLLYELLYRSASETMDELSADRKYLGARIGYINILHTWGSAMNYHPHLHCIVLGGGLDGANHWRECHKNFFLPIPVIARVFRGKYIDGLKQLWKENKLEFHGTAELYRNRYEFKELINTCYSKEWRPYSKETFGGAESVIKYLGRYTHRIAISNHRIISMDKDKGTVTYRIKAYSNGGEWKVITVGGVEFIRRFLMHVPPKRFVRIRHYGILSSRLKRQKIALCRNLLGCKEYISVLRGMNTGQILKKLYGIDIFTCQACGSQRLLQFKGRKLKVLAVKT